MKFFRRIVDLWFHAILLPDGRQEPLHDLSASEDLFSAGKDLQVASPLIDLSSECVHGPNDRKCWTTGFNISTDYERYWPNTGVTRQVNSPPSI